MSNIKQPKPSGYIIEIDARHELYELELFNKAEKITEWAGGVFFGDDYHDTIEEALWACYEANEDCGYIVGDIDWPTHLWAAKECVIVNYLPAAEELIDNTIENAEADTDIFDSSNFSGVKELNAALTKFRELNKGVICLFPDTKKAIEITKEMTDKFIEDLGAKPLVKFGEVKETI